MKSYFRFLSRNKLYTLINIAGLVVSLMFVILMGDYTWRQYSIDSWHKNAERIYLTGNEKMFYMWPQAAEEIKNQCPEVEKTCCVLSADGIIRHGQQEVKSKDAQEGIIMLADSTFFQFFDFDLVKGDRLMHQTNASSLSSWPKGFLAIETPSENLYRLWAIAMYISLMSTVWILTTVRWYIPSVL